MADVAAQLVVTDLPALSVGLPVSLTGPSVTPAQRIFFYSSGEWEEFIKEWAIELRPAYRQVKRLGGAGDEGIDVAGFKSEYGFEGPWDLFQGKHYADPIGPSDAWPEMLKVFIHVDGGDYVMPDTYNFLAPKGCGMTLNRMLSKPSKLKEKFLLALADGSPLALTNDAETLGRVRGLAASTDFSIFKSVELHDALKTHESSPRHLARFGGTHLPSPTPFSDPPDEFQDDEVVYIAELRKVYSERCNDDLSDPSLIGEHPDFGTHFKRQRFAFYAAESIRMDARDAVPEGTFERLQDDVHDGVVEIAEAEHDSGMKRLTEVLSHSTALDLSSHPLMNWASPKARQGICHQLANDQRLSWIRQVKS